MPEPHQDVEPRPGEPGARAPYEPPRILEKRSLSDATLQQFSGTVNPNDPNGGPFGGLGG